MAVINTVKDPRITAVRELATVAARRAARRCVLEGELLINQALAADARLEFVLTTERDRITGANCPVHEATPGVLRQAVRAQKPVTALAIAELPTENAHDYGELAVVCEDIADPGNLGTIVRTACGLGARDVVLTDPDTDLTSRRVLEASRAAVLRAVPHRYPDPVTAVRALRCNGFEVVATSPRGPVVQSLAPLSGAPVAVVLGNETEGVSDAVLAETDHVVRVPMADQVESLNVGVAAGVSLAELRQRMLRVSLPRRCAAAVFDEAVRAALAERLAGSAHCDAAEFEALTRAVAGQPPPEPLASRLRAAGWWHPEQPEHGGITSTGEELLAGLWPDYLACCGA